MQMTAIEQPVLSQFFARFSEQPEASSIRQDWCNLAEAGAGTDQALISLYDSAIKITEKALWGAGCPDDLVDLYQRLFCEMESHLATIGEDQRRGFVIVIPVADRPQQLQNCLESLVSLCQRFGYGGASARGYAKLSVLIADDSKEPANIKQHQKLVEACKLQGLESLYFGRIEQLQQLDRLTQQQRQALCHVLGSNQPTAFFHKGASITRNLAYLKLAELAKADRTRLFWFIDSDEEFRISTGARHNKVYAINYFQRLNQFFTNSDILVLTGKVVGDPPVSPAVMAGNFLEDVIAFLLKMARLNPHEDCRFHSEASQPVTDAAYHDMADLFGFKPTTRAVEYSCRIVETHDHARCFADFCVKLNRFFDGEHPTRCTAYLHEEALSGLQLARTVYTGNYVLTAKALEFFIPFASLKLRMAGPVLGRILQAELGRGFVSANLPLEHKRALDEIGHSEFRPGIARDSQQVDLSGEFERQFYGDVMLFTLEQLCQQGYPAKFVPEAVVEGLLTHIEASMQDKYLTKQTQIKARLKVLAALFEQPEYWWNRDSKYHNARASLRRFIRNMEYNFSLDSPGYRMIRDASHRRQRHQQLLAAIMQLPQARSSWLDALANQQ